MTTTHKFPSLLGGGEAAVAGGLELAVQRLVPAPLPARVAHLLRTPLGVHVVDLDTMLGCRSGILDRFLFMVKCHI